MDPLDPKHYRLSAHLSTAWTTFDVAQRLRDLAKTSHDHREGILAASVVAATVALAQGADAAIIRQAADEWARGNVESTDPADSSFGEVLNLTIRQKVLRLPRILSRGKFQMNKRHPIAITLNRLIDKRNQLVHIQEKAHLLTDSDSSVSITDHEHLGLREMRMRVVVPENPWTTMSEAEADEYLHAVRAYLDQLLEAPSLSAFDYVPFLEHP